MAARIIAFAAGALFCHQLAVLPDPLYAGLLPLLLPAALAGVRGLAVPAAFALGIGWTALAGHHQLAARLPAELHRADLDVTGAVVGVPRPGDDRLGFTLAVESVRVPPGSRAWAARGCRVYLTWYRPPPRARLRAGERWRMTVRLRVPRGTRNHGGFDREHRALREGTCATGYLRSTPPPRLLEPAGPTLDGLREVIAERLERHLAGIPAAGMVRALALGLRDRVTPQQTWVMQSTGTAHLMAISGLHVGLIAALAAFGTRFVLHPFPAALCLLPRAHWCALAALAAAAGYAALAGFSIPTCRALLMLGAFLGTSLARRRCARTQPLALALGLLLITDPLAAWDPATWLSFAAVGGLLWALPPHAGAAPSLGGRLRQALHLQAAACLVLAPVALLCFSYQSPAAPLANLLAVPVTGLLAVPAIFAGLAADPVLPDLAGHLLRFAGHTLGVLLEVLDGMPGRDGLLVPAAAPSLAAAAAAAVGAGLLASPLPPRLRLLGLAWLVPLALPTPAGPGAGELEVRVVDVGQGLASVVRTEHHVLVFDAGPSWGSGRDAGAGIVAPVLRREGIARVDLLLVSHHHADHAGGVPGLTRVLRVRRLLGLGGDCAEGRGWRWDGYRFRVLHPPPHSARRGNDASCVLHVSGPGGSVLLPADLEARGEREMVARHGATVAAEVIVVPHHGSRTSSSPALLDAAAPRLAINSSGHRNRFGLPHAAVIARYRQRGITVLDTACDGEVAVRLAPGTAPRVQTFAPRSLRFWHDRDPGPGCTPPENDARRFTMQRR